MTGEISLMGKLHPPGEPAPCISFHFVTLNGFLVSLRTFRPQKMLFEQLSVGSSQFLTSSVVWPTLLLVVLDLET